MLRKALFSTLSVSLLTTAIAAPTPASEVVTCVDASEQEIAALFDRWNNSLATLDPTRVAANYSETAVLLPTVSNVPRDTPEEIQDYFVQFLLKKPQGAINERTIKIGCNQASDVGIYTFTLHDEQGKASTAVARYSYIYSYQNGRWLIDHHHSSLMPEPVAEE